jgi:mRNA-degrading endonuclease RelE of RelBE toxin-antitoxin system
MLTVIETPMFLRYSADVWSDDEREAFVDWIAENPEAGDVMPGFTPLRKVRWSREGTGKRGGVRVIYFITHSNGTVSLLIVYPKSKTETLSPAFLRELRKLMR